MSKRNQIIGVLLILNLFGLFAAGQADESGEYDPDNFVATGDRIVKEDITINVFAPGHPNLPDWEDMKLFEVMAKKTGITLTFEHANPDIIQERKTLLWKDKENLPDLIMYSTSATELQSHINVGAVQDLKDAIKNYAPNFQELLDTDGMLEKAATAPDSGIYSFISMYKDTLGIIPKMYINARWLDIVGMDVPRTTSEVNAVMQAFLDNADKLVPAGSTADDLIPWGAMVQIPNSYLHHMVAAKFFVSNSLGHYGTMIEVDQAMENVVAVPTTEEYRYYLQYMNNAYEKGYITPQAMEDDVAAYITKISSGRIGMFDGWYHAVAAESDVYKPEDYVCVGPIVDDMGPGGSTRSVALSADGSAKQLWLEYAMKYNPGIAIVPTGSPYTREIVRYLDMLYSEEMLLVSEYGVEGEDWSWTDDSKNEWKFINPVSANGAYYSYPMSQDDTIALRATFGRGNYLGARFLTGFKSGPIYDFQMSEAGKKADREDEIVQVYKGKTRAEMPLLTITDENDQETIAEVGVAFNNYMIVNERKFITGDLDPDSDADWSTFQKGLVTIGIENYVAAYQKYVDLLK